MLNETRIRRRRDAADLALRILKVIKSEIEELPESKINSFTKKVYEEDFWKEINILRCL